MNAAAILDQETLSWISAAEQLPDSDTTVMVHAPKASEPVWLGYHDGDSWFSVDGSEYGNEEELIAEVVAWAEMPMGTGRS